MKRDAAWKAEHWSLRYCDVCTWSILTPWEWWARFRLRLHNLKLTKGDDVR